MHVLVTRPQPEAEATALALREMDIRVTVAPMLHIEPTPPPAQESRIDDVQAVVLTSANAARALIKRPLGAHLMERDLPVFAVGESTAAAARDAGFGHVTSADGDVDRLVALLAGKAVPGRGTILYPCGEHTARELSGLLSPLDLDCRAVVVYAAKAQTYLPRAVEQELRDRRFDLVMFYSARTAGIFADLIEAFELAPYVDETTALCLSQGVAGRAQALRWRAIEVAQRPDQTAMLASVRKLRNTGRSGSDTRANG